jgi:hypothetical protein
VFLQYTRSYLDAKSLTLAISSLWWTYAKACSTGVFMPTTGSTWSRVGSPRPPSTHNTVSTLMIELSGSQQLNSPTSLDKSLRLPCRVFSPSQSPPPCSTAPRPKAHDHTTPSPVTASLSSKPGPSVHFAPHAILIWQQEPSLLPRQPPPTDHP